MATICNHKLPILEGVLEGGVPGGGGVLVGVVGEGGPGGG